MSITLSALQQQRRDTAANWTSANPTLLAGEIGVETDTGLLKIGDGITAWTSLDYLPLSFEGYAANGIYNPAANQVALATNGTGRLFIDSSGNIGVGTSSPSVNLEVSSASYPQLRVTDSAASVSTKVMSTPTTGNIGTHTNHDLQIVTNNTERVRIDSSGRVGIGTSSPGNALNVVGSSATTNTGATVLVDDSASLAANIGGSIAFRGTDGTNTRTYGLIRGGKLDSSSGSFDGYLAFETRSNGQATTSEHLRITNAGNVGIGTSSPQYLLDVYKSTGTNQDVFAVRGQTSAFLIQCSDLSAANPIWNLRSFAAEDIAIKPGGTESVRFASSGRVGIGTSSPSRSLSIASTDPRIGLTDTDAGGEVLFQNTSGNGIVNVVGSHDFTIKTANSDRFIVKNTGNVGIGSSSPSAPLAFGKSTYGDPSSENFYRIKFKDFGGTANDVGIGQPDEYSLGLNIEGGSTASIRFSAGTAGERMRIDGEGRVGIGTSSPNASTKLHVAGSICVDNNSGLYGINSAATSAYRIFHIGGDNNVYINANPENNAVVIQSGVNSEAMRIDSSGRLLVGTSSDLSGGDADARLQVNGDAGAQILLSRQDFGALTAGTLIGEVVFRSQASGVKETSALIKCEADATQGSVDKPGRLVFSTTADGSGSPTERMRIPSTGNILTYSDNNMQIKSGNTGATLRALSVSTGATSVTTGSLVFQVMADGDVENTNGVYGAISDLKLKENIVDAGSQWDDIKSLQVRKYNFKENTGLSTHTQIGLVAQEVELVSPGLVGESPDIDEEGKNLGTTTKSVSYSVLYMKAVKALQEAMERIETLEQRLTDAGL